MKETTHEERHYSIGGGIIERHEAKILAAIPKLYKAKDRYIVENILLPHFRKQLKAVFDSFRETKSRESDQPLDSREISEICERFDEMIGQNAELLDIQGLFRPVFIEIESARKRIAQELEEQSRDDVFCMLRQHGITDRRTLVACGPKRFSQLDFGACGLGKGFLAQLLGKSVRKLNREMTGRAMGNITLKILEKAAEALHLPELSAATKDKCKAALAKHGIADRDALIDWNPVRFEELDFGEYGKGKGFAGFVFGRVFKYLSKRDLECIADTLEMKNRQASDKKEEALRALAIHQITDRLSLIACGAKAFRELSFEAYGGAKAFLGTVLGRKISTINLDVLREFANALSLPQLSESTLVRCRVALCLHGITDRSSLMAFGTVKFNQTTFSYFKNGPAFVNAVLGRNVGVPNRAVLGEFADALGM